MDNQKDELISGAELAKRLDVNRSYITNKKTKLKDAKCTFGKKFYYIKSCHFLGKDPNEPHKSRQSELQTDIAATKKPSKKKETPKSDENWNVIKGQKNIDKALEDFAKDEPPKDEDIEDDNQDSESEAKELLDQILLSVKGGNGRENRAKLDILKQKAGVLREYFTAKNEEIKNRKLEDNLFERDEVIKILSFAMSMIRNALIDLPNNYAVSLEGRDQKEIKDHVTDDINRILEDLQNVGNQFE